VPVDIAREKQQQLSRQLLSAETGLELLRSDHDGAEETLRALLHVIEDCGRGYLDSDDRGRRDYNQAFFEALELDSDEGQNLSVVQARRTDVVSALHESAAGRLAVAVDNEQRRRSGYSDGVAPVQGLNFSLLVETRGLEPLTPALQRRCSARLSYAPGRRRAPSIGSNYRRSGAAVASVHRSCSSRWLVALRAASSAPAPANASRSNFFGTDASLTVTGLWIRDGWAWEDLNLRPHPYQGCALTS